MLPLGDDPSPYAFLSALDGSHLEDRTILLATRGEEVKAISHIVLGSKLSTLYAFSGNGKTSLINAGLIPCFADLGYAVFKTRPRPPFALSSPAEAFKECCIRENWVPGVSESDLAIVEEARTQLRDAPAQSVVSIRRLLERLEAQLSRLSAGAESRSADLSAFLRRNAGRQIPEFLESAQRFLGTNVPMVIICDQFEEIFVHYYNTPALEDFIDALARVCNDSAIRAHFLFSMREDWVGSMITFRRVIPDVLNASYRLDPIRRSKALPALVLPPSTRGVVFETEAADAILDDLCAFYRRQQRAGLAAARLTPSPSDDPFIELPALQAVGEGLWTTRTTAKAQPFTLGHYRSLVPPEEISDSGSPAAAVLEHYLGNMLQGIDDGKGKPDPDLNELRLDTLYLLTDKVAHRRALSEKELLAQLRGIRPAGLKLPPVDVALFRQAIEPLQANLLIREDRVTLAESRFELAHDFVVRSVVRAWNELDRRRVRDLAILSRERERVDTKLADLTRAERTGLVSAVGLPLLVLAGVAAIMYFGLSGAQIPGQFGFSVLWAIAAPAMILLAASTVVRIRPAVVLAIIALASAVGLRISQQTKSSPPSLYIRGSSSRAALADLYAYKLATQLGAYYPNTSNYSRYRYPSAVSGTRSDLLDLFIYVDEGHPALSRNQIVPSSQFVRAAESIARGLDIPFGFVFRALEEVVSAYSSTDWQRPVVPGFIFYGPYEFNSDLGKVCFYLGLICMACYASMLWSISRRWPFSIERQHTLAGLYGECIDIIVGLVLCFLCLLAVRFTPLKYIVFVPDLIWPVAFIASVLLIYTIGTGILSRRTGRTPGSWAAGIEYAELAHAPIGRVFARQALLGVWAIPNVLWLLPAVVLRVLTRKPGRAPFYHRILFRQPTEGQGQGDVPSRARSAAA